MSNNADSARTIGGSNAVCVTRKDSTGYHVGDSAVYESSTAFVDLFSTAEGDLMGFDTVHGFLFGLAGDSAGWLTPPEAQAGVRHRYRQEQGVERLPSIVTVRAEITRLHATPSGSRRLYEVACEIVGPEGERLADLDMTLIESPRAQQQAPAAIAAPVTPVARQATPSEPKMRLYVRQLFTDKGRKALLRGAKKRARPLYRRGRSLISAQRLPGTATRAPRADLSLSLDAP